MKQEFHIGQIFVGRYSPDAAIWCNANGAVIKEIAPIEREVEETYVEIETTTREVEIPAVVHEEIIPAKYNKKGNIPTEEQIITVVDEPARVETVEEKTPVEKTRKVVKRISRYEITAAPELSETESKQIRITELKTELVAGDYKIIKCVECSLAGEEPPYNIVELHAQRQALRDEINELEAA